MVCDPGASHHLPDFLSRASTMAPKEYIPDDIPCIALSETANGFLMGRYKGTDTPEQVEFDDVVEVQQADDYCVEMSKRVERRMAKAFLRNEHHALYLRMPYGNQLVIPNYLLLGSKFVSLSASKPHLGSGFFDFCLAAPAVQTTVTTGAITPTRFLLFFLLLLGVGLATASPSLVIPPPNPPPSHPTASVASFGAVPGAGVGPGGSLVVVAYFRSGSARGQCDTGRGHEDGVGGVADAGGGRPPHRPSPLPDHGVTADGRGGHASASTVATAMDGVGSDVGKHLEVYDSTGPSSPWRRHAARRDAFRPATIHAARATRPAISCFSLPPDHSAFPAPFEVVGDTLFAGVGACIGDTVAAELSFLYNVAAWLQQLHNRQR